MQPDTLRDILLANRNIGPLERESFLNPFYESLSDPFLMHDLERGVVRLYEAIENKEKIVVYADYDCDGIPGATIMSDLLRQIGYENVSYYIPDRQDEGYGLHRDAVEQFIRDGVKLVITIDLGTTAVDEIAHAQINGIDIVVTDHHEPPPQLPKPYALVNPKLGGERRASKDGARHGSAEPDPMLCGSGVIFQFVRGFIQKYGEYYKIPAGFEKWSLDMAGLATLSDMVPLVNENRIIASYGMKVFRKTRRPGLTALLRELKIDPTHISEDDITFMITPRINAASRMDSPMRAFELLSATDDVKGKELAKHLSKINDERKYLVATIMKEVKHTIAKRENPAVIVVGNPEWRAGILGLIAGKLSDEYKRPAFVWGGREKELIKGSCRSDGSASVVSLMRALPVGAVANFGGHELAGGFSVAESEIHFLEERILVAYESVRQATQVTKSYTVDSPLALADVTSSIFQMIDTLAPFGVGNAKPVFVFQNVSILELKMFGKTKEHLEIIVGDGPVRKKAIAFFRTPDSYETPVEAGSTIDLVATLEMSYFMNRPELRLRIVDIANSGTIIG